MRNIWRLFIGDLKRVKGNTLTLLVILGLVLMPSLFSWFNMLACWDVFDHTGRLTVAVANTDEGYESDLVPLKVNIGERVVSALRENDQLNWVFTTEADAIDGTQSGRYYAAVVIPPGFSRDMMGFYDAQGGSASIDYYSNEKKSAIAPKVTDRGADQVSNQVNRVFTETITEIALAVSSSLYDHLDAGDVNGRVGALAAHLQKVSDDMRKTADTLLLYANLVQTAQTLVDDSTNLLGQVKSSASDLESQATQAADAANASVAALEQSLQQLSEALDQSAAGYAELPAAVNSAFDYADDAANVAASQLNDKAALADAHAATIRELGAELAGFAESLPPDAAQLVTAFAQRLDATAALEEGVRDSLYEAAAEVLDDQGRSSESRAKAIDYANQAAASLEAAKAEYETNLQPALGELKATLADIVDTLTTSAQKLNSLGAGDMGGTEGLDAGMADAQQRIASAAETLRSSADEIDQLGKDIAAALNTGDIAELRRIIGDNPEAMANALSAPVEVKRTAIYPVDNFGSAMSPLYTTLALWIGVLLMMVAFKTFPSERTLRELDNPTMGQLFCGRFGIVALISFLQSTVLCLGNVFFLEVQVSDLLLYFACFWIAGLVFAFIVYTLVSTFGNLGKGFAVMLLIIQVSAGGGSFPLQMLPDAIQAVSPYLPITHVANAMREAMFGVYDGVFWSEMGILALFAVPFVFLGLVFRGPIVKGVTRFVEKVESSKVM